MNEAEMSEREDAALDAALAANLCAPPLPVHFRSRLLAGVRAVALEEQTLLRQALADDAQRTLSELRDEYVRVRRRSLVAYLGISFIAGLLMAIALPWMWQSFGLLGVYLVPSAAGAVGVAFGLTWLRRAGWLG